jgi:lysozyme
MANLTAMQKGGIGAAIAAAVAVAAPIAERWEGYSGKAYLDPAKVLTQCYGETRDVDPSLIYSQSECAKKLRARMARDYAPVLAKCMPALVGPDWPRYTSVYGALIDASYNAGPERVCIRFGPVVNAGGLKIACNALPTWFISARNRQTGERKIYQGLINRRNDERRVCLGGLA